MSVRLKCYWKKFFVGGLQGFFGQVHVALLGEATLVGEAIILLWWGRPLWWGNKPLKISKSRDFSWLLIGCWGFFPGFQLDFGDWGPLRQILIAFCPLLTYGAQVGRFWCHFVRFCLFGPIEADFDGVFAPFWLMRPRLAEFNGIFPLFPFGVHFDGIFPFWLKGFI